MAKVPARSVKEVEAQFAQTQGSTTFQNVRGVTESSFGGGTALSEAGAKLSAEADSIYAASNRLQERKDATTRVRELRKMRTPLVQRFEDITTGVGISEEGEDDDTDLGQRIASFRQEILNAGQQAVAQHAGVIPGSQEVFAGMVESTLAKLDGGAIDFGLKQSRGEADALLADHVAGLAATVEGNPSALGDALLDAEEFRLDNHAPGATPDTSRKATEMIADQIGGAAVRFFMRAGNTDRAAEVLREVEDAMSLTPARKLRLEIFGKEAEQQRSSLELENLKKKTKIETDAAIRVEKVKVEAKKTASSEKVKVDKATAKLLAGAKTEAAKTKIKADAKAKKDEIEAKHANKIKEIEAKRDADIEKARQTRDPFDFLGGSIEARATAILSTAGPGGQLSLIERFERGLTTLREDQFAISLITSTMEVSEKTGDKFISPTFAQALRERGFEPETFGDPGVVNDPRLFQPPIISTTEDGDTPALAEGAVQPAEEGADPVSVVFPSTLATLMGGKTIAELVFSGKFTGVGPAVRSFAGRTPVLASGAGVVDTLRTAIPLATKRLVTALQQNPRFAVMEREQLQEDLDVKPELWDNKNAMLGRLVGVDLFLNSLENELINSVKDLKQPLKQRKADRVSLRLIQATRERYLPDIVAETDPGKRAKAKIAFAEANPPGTPLVFLDANGSWVLDFTKGPPKTGTK